MVSLFNISLSIYKVVHCNSRSQIFMNNNQIIPTLNQSIEVLLRKSNERVSNGSNWCFHKINNFYKNIVKYKPLNRNTYIQLPENLRNPRQVLVNL